MSSISKGNRATGIVRRAWDAALDFIQRKEVVGMDKNGNKYYRYFQTTRGETVERREVKWGTLYVNYEPTDIPSEWRMWLRKLRDTPPTDDEMARGEANATMMKAKVAAIDEQERLRRLRMQNMGMQAQQASPQPNLGRFLEHSDSVKAETPKSGPTSNSGGGEFVPGAWRPGDRVR